MHSSTSPDQLEALEEELRRLKHLQKTRMLSLDDGRFVRDVVEEMNRRITALEARITALRNGTE
tara:strand:+ start:98 stop:289 length:192 start_codon:yes stop_codon:yes gene_type:complete